ncbi:hypothetical protein JCM17844_30070 [Iodidimonas gelatinilytica]|uniref:DUF11 domain-containing protein n=1 Tax=Iodidimonas gelatinilytica TaxID=1236966 RepID=A0A5A7MTW7_9PROT|nr:hypothetical protein [Iodidimonas gelatinilytica]GEQ99370.1 hypothetical protein JCM17844_30070 [Iodidimonas gelatinilytica]
MKTLNKLALSSALVALMAGTAHAQATDTITLAVTGGGTIQNEVNLVDTAVLAGQSGTLEFTITPTNPNGDPWGVNGLTSAGLVELTLDNAVFGNPVSQTAVADTGDGSCAAGVQAVTAGSTDSSIIFEIANIENCADPLAASGVLEITVPFALSSIAAANFSVGVEAVVGDTTLADTTAYEVNGGPLVEVGPAFVVTVDETGAAGATDRTLALGTATEKSFTQFTADVATDGVFTAQLGSIDVAAGNNATNLVGGTVGVPSDFDVSISGVSVAGIDKFTVGAVDVA